MNSITGHFSQLGHSIQRLARRLRHRSFTFDAKLSVNLLVFKLELGLKSEPPKAANDNHPRRAPQRTA